MRWHYICRWTASRSGLVDLAHVGGSATPAAASAGLAAGRGGERIADLGRKGSWPDILADLDSLTESKVEQDDKCLLLRPSSSFFRTRARKLQDR
jgi:hypothetical protein